MPNQYLAPVIQVPSSLLIKAITQALPMVITVAIGNPTTEAFTYQIGMNVKLTVPNSYGMYQANNLVGTILAVSGFNLTLDIDSSLFDAFVLPIGITDQPASIAPFGSRNLQYNNNNINNAPFRSYNNIGN